MELLTVIIEGIIAGLAGTLAAVISIYLQNKSIRGKSHLIKHKQNFEILKDAIRNACSEVAPSTKIDSKVDPNIELGHAHNLEKWDYYSIFNFWSKSREQSTDNQTVYASINTLLYNDMANHWRDLYNKLDKWIKSINETGSESGKLTKFIFDSIKKSTDYGELIKHEFSSTDVTHSKLFGKDDIYLAIYNILMGYDENQWSRLFNEIKNRNIEMNIKEIVKKLEKDCKISYAVADLNRITQEFLQPASEILGDMDKIMLSEKITGSCEYI